MMKANELAPVDVDNDSPGYTAVDLHGLHAVKFGDGSMMLAMGASALHLSPKQVAALEAFLVIRPPRPR